MKKHFSKALALLLALAMLLSVFPVMSFAVEEGEQARFLNGLPEDGSYGAIYNVEGYVMGADLDNGKAPAKKAELNDDQSGVKALPNGAAVLKFIQTGSDYYLTIGGKYLTVKDLDTNNKEKLVLTEAVETGSKWSIIPDKAGASGCWNFLNAEYKWNGSSDVYLEQFTSYGSSTFSPYSYKSSTPTLFQMKIAATEADEDGRVGEIPEAGDLPADGGKYVIYNDAAKAVFGQPTGEDVSAPALLAAAAIRNEDGSIDYENVADGGMIFTAHVSGSGASAVYSFENNGRYLAMPENKLNEQGQTENDETLLMIDWPEEADKQGYAQWTLTQVAGGYVMYNVSARYKSSKCCVEYFNEVFSGWSYKNDTPEIFAMSFVPMEDKDGVGYVVNPEVVIKTPDPAIGVDCPVEFEIHDVSEPAQITASYKLDNGAFQTAAHSLEVRKGSFTVPAAELEGGSKLTVRVLVTDALGKSYDHAVIAEIRDEPMILSTIPAANTSTGEDKRPLISARIANCGPKVEDTPVNDVNVVEKFTDVAANKWYTAAVEYVVKWGLMAGTGETVFGTNSPVTREQFVTILWKIAGSPEPTISNPFTDVKENYAYKAILWAYENGITSGKTETTFGRKDNVRRQDLAVFFLKYAQLRGLDTGRLDDLSAFTDVNAISSYAKTAVRWAVANGLIAGSDGKLNPKASATRAQIAAMMKKFDMLLNSHQHYENLSFEMLLDGAEVPAVVEGDWIVYTPEKDLPDGKHTVQVTVNRPDGKSVTRKWMFFIGEGGETLYFGQIHAHTAEYSDGVGTLEDAYEHAAGVDDLDFIIVTDHSNYFDSTATATTSSYYDLSHLTQNAAKTATKWEEARATAAEYNARYDDFLCVYGYEMTWSGGPGHTNSFNTYGVVSRNNAELNNKTGYAGMHRYNDLMVNADRGLDVDGNEAKTTRAGAEATGVNATKYIPFDAKGEAVPVVSQFNHPGTTFGNFDNYAGYSAKRDDVLNLIEVGNGEGKVGGSAYFPSYEEYDLCLAMGWHVGPTNNQDNHKGNWGDSNTCRDVILTDDFSEIGLYRALDARRIYATEDQNLIISYELEAGGVSYKLGDIAPIDDDHQPETVTARLSVSDPDRAEAIATVEIIGEGGKSLKKIEVNAGEFEQDITIPNTDGYYYIRVVEADGDIAVTAPVWVREAVPVAADLETNVAVAAQGEEETVIASLTNGSETEPLYLHGYKVEAEGRVLADETGLEGVVEPGKTEQFKLPFTPSATDPSAVKTYEITVTFQVVFKGKELSYTKTISETSYPPEMMTYIGLDKGHDNFYVSGDYAGNEGNFIDICAQRGILCKYIDKGEMTKENLARFKAVLITVPRVKGDGLPAVWTAEELEALADYAANGGTILSFSKSDRYDPADPADAPYENYYSSANLSNLVNEAIGAKTRFVRGIVVDNEKKANEAYRIYFNGRDLVGDHLFTQGIVPSSNGRYQWYNGTGITIEPGAEVTTLIAPYPSTWIACYKDNFTGSAYVPDYEHDTVMAGMNSGFALATAERLSGGGWLVCSGATFISNYDLKYGIAANEQYENYLLVCNILDYVKNGPFDGEITPIAEVHKGEVGQEFTVEGTVTANASDFDKDTAFFDCIYVQDETRGINCFPVSGYYFIGERVRVHGGVTYYCGEIELNLSNDYNGSIQVISNDVVPLEPTKVSCAEAMSDDNIGNLMKIEGFITEIHETAGVIDKIYVDDGSGEEAMFFINGYIQKESHALDNAAVGMKIEGIGIGSRDVDEENGGADGAVIVDDPSLYIKRLRVRARDELLVYEPELDTTQLEAAIAEAEALDRSLYTEASLAALDEALTAARAVMADPDKDQLEVTKACKALRAALDGLAEKPAVPADGFTLSTAVSEGDQVLIYYPAGKLVLADSLNGNKVNGVSAEPVENKLAPVDGAAVYTVEYAEGDSVNFRLKMADGKYLTSAPTGNGMSFEESPNEYSLWYLEVLDAEAGTVVVHSTNAAYNNNKNQALEYYSGFTTFGYKGNQDSKFVFQIYAKPAE